MTYDEFRAQLKENDLTQLYFFTGEEDFLKNFCIAETKKALIDPSFEDFNYKCYIEAPSAEDAEAFINALPLMSQKKLVVFNNCNIFSNSLSEKSRWQNMFSQLPPHVVCIVRENASDNGKKGSVVEQAVKTMGITVNFEYLKEVRLKPWLIKVAASKGKSLSDKDSLYVIQNLGQSMTLLKTEMEKICAKAEEFVISRNDIDSVISNRLEESVFTLIDAVFSSRRDIAYNVLSRLEKSRAEPVSVLGLLSSQALNIYKAKLMMTQKISLAEVKKAVSRNPYAAEKMVSKASKISFDDIERLIFLLTEADKNIKTGAMDPHCALDLIIAG